MASKDINIEELSDEAEKRVILDVRSPGEYAKGHIPGAINLPLFSNIERAIVGTKYKQESLESAMVEGLRIVGPKMANLYTEAERLAPDRNVLIHCWRGGKRSQSMAWLLDLMGFDVYVLKGGYKAYRRYVHTQLPCSGFRFIILGGKTGCGKTAILHALKRQGQQIIDLEALAHHKGSAFGWIGENNQPTVEQFENNLYAAVQALDPAKPVWIENESQSVGQVYIPDMFWDKMKVSPLVNIEMPLEERLNWLIHTYATTSKEDLLLSFQKIKKRIGGKNLKDAEHAIQNGNLKDAAAIALHYYDKTYEYNLNKNKAPEITMLQFDKLEPDAIAREVLENVKLEVQR